MEIKAGILLTLDEIQIAIDADGYHSALRGLAARVIQRVLYDEGGMGGEFKVDSVDIVRREVLGGEWFVSAQCRFRFPFCYLIDHLTTGDGAAAAADVTDALVWALDPLAVMRETVSADPSAPATFGDNE